MDIFAIIKENLPDGVELNDKAIKAIAKEISTEQGKEFIPKESYSKKTERIDELEKEIKELQGKGADADSYKAKYEAELEAHNTTKSAHESAKSAEKIDKALSEFLSSKGLNEKVLSKALKMPDRPKVELDKDGKIKDSDKVLESFKVEWDGFFGEVKTAGADVADPPQKAAVSEKEVIRLAAEQAMGIVTPQK